MHQGWELSTDVGACSILLFCFVADCRIGHWVTGFIYSRFQTQGCATQKSVGVCTGRSCAAAVWGEGDLNKRSRSVPGLFLIWLLNVCSVFLGLWLTVRSFRCSVLALLYIKRYCWGCTEPRWVWAKRRYLGVIQTQRHLASQPSHGLQNCWLISLPCQWRTKVADVNGEGWSCSWPRVPWQVGVCHPLRS